MTSWYGMTVAAGLGVPGYAAKHDYNYLIFAFWGCKNGPMDVGIVWQNLSSYLGEKNPWGTTDREVQIGVKKVYNQAGVRILVSAFGATEFPTTYYVDPVACGHALGNFVLHNNLDGADVDWEDNTAMEDGKGEEWLISFTKALRQIIPDHIVTHAPQAPYFKNEFYRNGAYMTVHKAVGDLINFYIIQFYNQGDSKYDNYDELFVHASGKTFNGTALLEIHKRGVPLKKLVVAKPILPNDATNTGYMPAHELGAAVDRAYQEHGWYGGVAHWQYPSDTTGNAIHQSAGGLIEACKASGKCK
jgi:chitinase